MKITCKQELKKILLNTTSFLFNHKTLQIAASPTMIRSLKLGGKLLIQTQNIRGVPIGGWRIKAISKEFCTDLAKRQSKKRCCTVSSKLQKLQLVSPLHLSLQEYPSSGLCHSLNTREKSLPSEVSSPSRTLLSQRFFLSSLLPYITFVLGTLHSSFTNHMKLSVTPYSYQLNIIAKIENLGSILFENAAWTKNTCLKQTRRKHQQI